VQFISQILKSFIVDIFGQGTIGRKFDRGNFTNPKILKMNWLPKASDINFIFVRLVLILCSVNSEILVVKILDQGQLPGFRGSLELVKKFARVALGH
jgi:hypothetical protein